MTPHDQLLTPDQELLLQQMLAGKKIEEAATTVGISRRTAQRWLELPHVATAYAAARQDISEHVREQIKALSTKAITALNESLDGEMLPAVRLKAAQLVLDRVAPAQPPATATQQTTPLQAPLIDPALAAYLTFEELDTIEQIASNAEQRRAQAEQDRETLERKRG